MHGASRRLGSATYVAILLCTELSYSVCAIEAAEFDLPLVIACRDVTPDEFAAAHPAQRVIGASIRVSVRFHGDDAREIEQLNIDVLGTSNAQRVYRFAPTTQLISDLGDTIEYRLRGFDRLARWPVAGVRRRSGRARYAVGEWRRGPTHCGNGNNSPPHAETCRGG